jgi:signal transduction histidine kinase
VVAILVILAWLAYLARIRQIARTVEDRLRAQNAERERIARELHDTLLQSVQGLLLRFQAVSDQLPPSSAHREALESALDVADEVVAEARDRVASLRALVRPAAYVHDAIAAVGNELAATSVMSFTMTVHGDPHPLRDECSDEIYFIAREALLNAFQHARGSSVEGEVAYLPDAIQIRIADDGRGIPTEIAQQGRRSGHWGLVGMRERARELGADMSVLERPGGGSIIQLDVPLEGVCAPPARMRLPWRASAAAR